MNQKDLIDLISENRASIVVLENEIKVWKENYVRLNRKFQDGDKALAKGYSARVSHCYFIEGEYSARRDCLVYKANMRRKDGSIIAVDLLESELTKVDKDG